ncbi:MAG: Rpn family recombination-promoting nuclease/putative transposase [Prevotella sp.]|nr:Rpn family recombination-promoting nuclease/putative transposase [Prevotella sp.]
MRLTEGRYISLLTDFGFKRIFGSDINKDLLIDFLNSLFNGEQVVKNVTYLNSEHVGDVYAERKAIFDVYCENEHGEKFIVEMQNAYQTYFKDRSLYYATFPIREQAPKGDNWNFKLQHVYVVALLNYEMSDEAFSHESINHDVGLLDKQTHKVFNNKLTFKYVEIARFNKDINELETNFDKWLYVLRNLSRLDNQPTYLRNEVFNRLFSQAEIARFDKKELKAYEDSLKAYRDIKNSLDTAKEEGRAEGLAEGLEKGLEKGRAEGASEKALTIAREMLALNISVDTIKKVTGLTDNEIHDL